MVPLFCSDITVRHWFEMQWRGDAVLWLAEKNMFQEVQFQLNPYKRKHKESPVMTGLKKENESFDMVKGSAVSILQQKDGYRFSIDSILLADFVKIKKYALIADLGSGSGIISLIVAARFKSVRITGIELQESLVDISRRNISINDMESRIRIVHGDITRVKNYMTPHTYDAVVCNPPYRRALSGRVNMRRQQAIARHEVASSIRDFCRAAGIILKDRGWFFIIFPASRAAELISEMKHSHIQPKRMRIVYSSASSRAAFVLVAGVKEGGEELEIMPPLYIYKAPGVYTDEIEEMYKNLTWEPAISGQEFP